MSDYSVKEEIEMKRIKILLIAPYKGLYEMANTLKNERDDVQLDIWCGNLSEGARIAAKLQHNGYDAVISRGGTALEIRKVVDLPVIDIEFSAYDMMRILRMADCMSAKEAIVGYPSIAKCAKVVSELMNRDICVKTINSEAEVRETIKQLREEQYSIVIGDQIVHDVSMKLNMNSILFLSGPESLHQSIEEAVRISLLNRKNHRYIENLEKLLDLSREKIYAVDRADQNLIYTNWHRMDKFGERVKQLADEEMNTSEKTVWETEGDYIWKVRRYRFDGEETRMTVCYAEEYCANTSREDDVIQFKRLQDMPEIFYHKYYGEDERMRLLCEDVAIYGKTLLPILLVGEQGVGKTNMAYAMHKESAMRKRLFIGIASEKLRIREFERIFTEHRGLLFNREGGTVYFENIDRLPSETQEKVLKYITNPAVAKNFRFIFSSTANIGECIHNGGFHRKLARAVSELVLAVPPLRERISCIEGIAGMMLHELNMQYGKNVIGFDAAAREKLKSYRWPGNIAQLHRVITEAALNCRGARITAAGLEEKIIQEAYVSCPETRDSQINMDQPLEGIIDDVIRVIMKEENMNQTKVAERLEISRSTLWRRLNGK